MPLTLFFRGYTFSHYFGLALIGMAYGLLMFKFSIMIGGDVPLQTCIVFGLVAMGHALISYRPRAGAPPIANGRKAIRHLLFVGGLGAGVLFMGLHALFSIAAFLIPVPTAASAGLAIAIIVAGSICTCVSSIRLFSHHFTPA